MKINYIDNISGIEKEFLSRFVLSWDAFQIKQKDWIAEMNKSNCPITKHWYDQSYMWDRMDPKHPHVSMIEALRFLRNHSGTIMFATEKGENAYFQGKKSIAFIAEADVLALADRIEYEWYSSYGLTKENKSYEDPLPDDLYVFDNSMKWCVVFTHETTDYDLEIDTCEKAARNRYCIICEAKEMLMNDIELFLSGEMSIEAFKELYKNDVKMRDAIDSILTNDAKESPDYPLWKNVSYEALKENGFSLTKCLEEDGAFNGSLGDDYNLHDLLSTFYIFYHPDFKPTDLYEKRFDFYLDAVGEYFEGPEVRSLLDSIIRDNLSITPKTKRIRETKTQIKALFHVQDNNRPYWIQGAEWPMGKNSPMKYVKRKRQGESVDYYFEDVDTKEIRIVKQYY